MKNKGLLLVISGPAGVGKGTVCKEYLSGEKDTFLSVSATTRKPRAGEEDGVSYHFREREEFERLIREEKLLEYACFCGNYYGTLREEVGKKICEGSDVILEIEVQGAIQIRERYPEAVLIFVMPPSYRELEDRLRGRGTETPEVIEKRLKRAMEEFRLAPRYDYILVNDEIEKAVKRLKAIVCAEKYKADRNLEFIREVYDNDLSAD